MTTGKTEDNSAYTLEAAPAVDSATVDPSVAADIYDDEDPVRCNCAGIVATDWVDLKCYCVRCGRQR